MTAVEEDLRVVQDSLTSVKGQTLEMTVQDEKRLRWALGIKVVLLAFITLYMGWAYANLRTVSADLLVIKGQQQFYESLPSLKTAMVDRLKKVAPDLVDQTGDEVVKRIPQLEKQLETAVRNTLLEMSGPLEKDLTDWLSTLIRETKGMMDEMYPGLSSYEKITRYRKTLLGDFREGIERIILHSKYFLARKDLTEKEKLQRDIIAVWYLMLQNHIADQNVTKFKMAKHQS